MKILYLCGREPEYTRNKILFKAFSANAEVINISSSKKSYLKRYFQVLLNFFSLSKHDYDVVFIGFFGQPLVFIFKLLTRKPLIFDAFISTYQTLCFDRKKFKPNSVVGRLAFLLDKWSCRLADLVLLDTNAHIKYFVGTFNLDPAKFQRVFVGADEDIFYPRDFKEDVEGVKRVFFYCEYQPLHGVEYIVRAAKLLEKDNIYFQIVGKGKERKKIDELVKNLEVKNIEFVDWVDYQELPVKIFNSALCLGGHFGLTDKADMVIPGKTFQFIAMNKPVIIALGSGNRELFDESADIAGVKRGNSEHLAQKISEIITDKQKLSKISNLQYEIYQKNASERVITQQISQICMNYTQ